MVEAKGDMPAYCRVQGTIKPTVGFEMRLPLTAWNGKFYQAGCGGYCGTLTTETPGYANGIVESVKRGYASIRADGGHQAGSPADGAWALGNRAALELYAHGWIPLAHAAGMEITRAFYGSDPKYSYLVGCSNGGRVGLVAAQRYPTLFNGIIVGCPAVDLTQAGGTFGAWLLNKNRHADAPVLTRDFERKLPFLIAAVNAQCDGRDGQVDGLIAEPSSCRINHDRIPTCPEGQNEGASPDHCLTAEEKEVVRLWHQGPRDSRGRQLFGGMPVGSEHFWKDGICHLHPRRQARKWPTDLPATSFLIPRDRIFPSAVSISIVIPYASSATSGSSMRTIAIFRRFGRPGGRSSCGTAWRTRWSFHRRRSTTMTVS